MNYCVKCGKKLQASEKFCTNCGNPLPSNIKRRIGGLEIYTDLELKLFDPITYLNNLFTHVVRLPKLLVLGIFSALVLGSLVLIFQNRNDVPDCNDSDILAIVEDLSMDLIKKEYVRIELTDLRKKQIEANNFLNILNGDFGSAARAGRFLSGGYNSPTEADLPMHEINFSSISLITEESINKETPKRECRAKVISTLITKSKSSKIEAYIEYEIQPDKSNDGENVVSVRFQ